MKPAYGVIAAAYPKKPGVDQAMLYTGIGHAEFATDRQMENTCATRVSIALLAAGISPVPGNLTVRNGRFAGKRLETNQKALSKFLAKRLGQPEVYKNGYEAWRKIRPRRGIISFMGIYGAGSTQGHIDLVEPATMNDLQCASACYWSSAEVWFWPLR